MVSTKTHGNANHIIFSVHWTEWQYTVLVCLLFLTIIGRPGFSPRYPNSHTYDSEIHNLNLHYRCLLGPNNLVKVFGH